MATAGPASTCSTIAAPGSRRRTEDAAGGRHTHTHTQHCYTFKCTMYTLYTHTHIHLKLFSGRHLKNGLRTGLKSHPNYFAKLFIVTGTTAGSGQWWCCHRFTLMPRCVPGVFLTTIALRCSAGLLSTNTHIQIHTEEQEYISNLLSVSLGSGLYRAAEQ